MEKKILYSEDFLSYEKTPVVIDEILNAFEKFFSEQFPVISRPDQRVLNISTIERMLSQLVRSSSPNAINSRSDERFERLKERKRDLPELKGKSTSPSVQYKFQFLDYLIYGNGSTLKSDKAYITEYEGFSFLAKLIVILQTDNAFSYDKLNLNPEMYNDAVKSIHESLRTDYRNSYVSGTLEGFPKGIRISSARGRPRVMKIKQ